MSKNLDTETVVVYNAISA